MRFAIYGMALGVFVVACGGSSDSELTIDAGADGTSGSDGGTTGNDGGTTGNDGGGTFTDAGNPTTIPCGNSTCTLPGQTCCVQNQGQTPTFTCINGTTCPNNQTGLHCQNTASCAPGLVCCVAQQGQVTTSNCKATCAQNEAQLCDPKASNPGCVPANQQCSSTNIVDWGLPNTFATCGGKGN